MADFSCTTTLLLCPCILIILLLSSININFSNLSSSFFPTLNQTTAEENLSISRLPEDARNVSINGFVLNVRGKSNFQRREEGLARARAAIQKAARLHGYNFIKEDVFVPRGSIYKNPRAFYQSHTEMQRQFKVWPYKEGYSPLFHSGPMNNIYSIEGQFMDEIESGKSPYLARNPDEAHAFFIPVSIVNIIRYVYRPYTNYSRDRLQNVVKDYINLVSKKYPYWNRTKGADHFMVSCHDWAPDVTAADPEFFKHFIRVLCNANTSEFFKPVRDVSLPEIHLEYGKLRPSSLGKSTNNRTILAFFAGGEHGSIRKQLLDVWKDKDADIRVHGYLPKDQNYSDLMLQSKYCLCPSGFEVASPRIVESIYAGCVPVIISEGYVLPFSDVLDWSRFSVQVPVAEIPRLEKILQEIPEKKYLKKQKGVIKVQRHFVLNRPSKPYDLLHMVMHSVWLRRLNIKVPV